MAGIAQTGCGCLLGVLIVGLIVLVSAGTGNEGARVTFLGLLAAGSLGLFLYAMHKRNPRVEHIPRPPKPKGPWSCASCGEINPEERHGCSACGEPRA